MNLDIKLLEELAIGSLELEYKGKRYRVGKIKDEQRVIPVGEKYNNDEETERKKITVKDYEVGAGNVTVNVNGETIIVDGGPIKHLTVWGSVVVLLIMVAYYFIYRLRKLIENNKKELSKQAKKIS